jgi:hypothetical protein
MARDEQGVGPMMATRRQATRSGAGLFVTMALLAGCVAAPPTAPVPTPTPSPAVSPAPTPSFAIATADPLAIASVEPTDASLDPGVNAEYEPPAPTCPSPPGAVIVPDVRVSVGDGPAVIAGRGASTFWTCTTTAATDVAGDPPLPWLTATHRDRLVLQVQTGWRILRIEGYDSSIGGQGGDITPPIDLADRPDRVEVAVPARDGDARAAWTLWLIRADGKAVGQLSVTVRLHLPAAN